MHSFFSTHGILNNINLMLLV